MIELPACDLDYARNADILPVQAPRRPVDHLHSELRTRLLGGWRALPVGRPKPTASHPGQISDRVEAAREILPAEIRSDAVVALVAVAMQTKLVAARDDLPREMRVRIDLAAKHEERRLQLCALERIQDRRRRVFVWPVVEGEHRLPVDLQMLEARIPAPPARTSRVPFIEALSRGPRQERSQ